MKQKTIWMEWIIQINDMRKTWMKMWMKIICTYKQGTAAAERRGTVSCEIIQRQLLN